MPFAPLPDGDELYYETHGEGPPLLIVSGLGGRSNFWQAHLPHLVPDFKVILHDHRGTGQSSKPHFDYSVDQMADDVIALLDHLEIEKAGLCGHSTGGAIGQVIAVEQPERLSALMLASSWPGKDAYFEELFRARKAMIQQIGPAEYVRTLFVTGWPPAYISQHPELTGTPPEADVEAAFPDIECFCRRIDAIRAFDRRADLPKIKAPTLVTCAMDDMMTPLHLSEELASLIPDADSEFIPFGAHFYPVVMMDTFIAQVKTHFQAHP